MSRFKAPMLSGAKKILRNIPGVKGVLNKINIAFNQSNTALEQNRFVLEQLNTLSEMVAQNEARISSLSQQTAILNEIAAQYDNLSQQLNTLKKEQQKTAIQQRFTLKTIHNIPIRVVFLVEEPSVLKNFLSVIEEINGDSRFEVVIVNLWYKVYKDNTYTYTRPNTDTLFDASKYNIIESYNKDTDEWLDLKALIPDYVFFSRPYDYYRKETYHIGQVAKYARTCYIPYGIQTIGGEVERMLFAPECADLYYFFMDNSVRAGIIKDILGKTTFAEHGHALYLGYPGIDMMRRHKQIKKLDKNWFTVLWLPRWNNGENNCHFFDYKDVLVDYAAKSNNCRVIFRPHPLCFDNFLKTGEITAAELADIRKKYSTPNEIDENANYIDAFSRSSVLVADETSLIAEYFLTDKPVIFCKKETHFSLLMEKLIEGCYVVCNENELEATLDMLRNGDDPLKQTRLALAAQFLTDYKDAAALNIKEELLQDFNGKYVY